MSSQNPPQPPAGWYELHTDPEIERYWDGSAWTDEIRVKSNKTASRFKIDIPKKHQKWYLLSAIAIIALVIVTVIVPSGKSASHKVTLSTPTIEGICEEILSHDWYELNSRQFKTAPDVAAREANTLFIEGVIEKSSDSKITDKDFLNTLNSLATYVGDFTSVEQLQPAVATATKVDEAFNAFTVVCEKYGVKAESPIFSEATDNKSEIDQSEIGRIPSDYVDSGEGIAYKLIPSKQCRSGQYGCTAVEMFAYRDCPRGVQVYANLFNADGNEVAVTDTHSDPLVAGQSTTVYLSTGLSTAASGKPNSFICE